jgi:hypothetical protein
MKKNLSAIILLILGVLLLIQISGCSQAYYQRRDIKKLDALAIQQNSEFLRLSNQLNPCFQGRAKSDTTVVFGLRDTMIVKGDTITSVRHDTIIRTIQLPGKIITINKLTTIHDTIPDERHIATLQAQIKDLNANLITNQTQLADSKATARKRLWWIIGLAAFIVIYFGIKVVTFIYGGGFTKIASGIAGKL